MSSHQVVLSSTLSGLYYHPPLALPYTRSLQPYGYTYSYAYLPPRYLTKVGKLCVLRSFQRGINLPLPTWGLLIGNPSPSDRLQRLQSYHMARRVYTQAYIPLNPIRKAVALLHKLYPRLGYPVQNYDSKLHILEHGAPVSASYVCL